MPGAAGLAGCWGRYHPSLTRLLRVKLGTVYMLVAHIFWTAFAASSCGSLLELILEDYLKSFYQTAFYNHAAVQSPVALSSPCSPSQDLSKYCMSRSSLWDHRACRTNATQPLSNQGPCCISSRLCRHLSYAHDSRAEREMSLLVSQRM